MSARSDQSDNSEEDAIADVLRFRRDAKTNLRDAGATRSPLMRKPYVLRTFPCGVRRDFGRGRRI